MKKTLIIISALIALIIGGAFIYRISQPRKLVHISIDDSICLNEIDNLNSPFDHHILKKLKLFHRLYGAKFSLYSFKPDSMTNNVQIKRSLDKDSGKGLRDNILLQSLRVCLNSNTLYKICKLCIRIR